MVELESTRSTYTPPIPPSDLAALGFDAYAMDCVDAPNEVLKYLCSASNLHAIPISFRGDRVRPQDMEQYRAIRRYIVADTVFTTTYSSYGRKLPQTMSRVLKPLRNFAYQQDSSERERAEENMTSYQRQLDHLQSELERRQHDRTQHAQHCDALAQDLARIKLSLIHI